MESEERLGRLLAVATVISYVMGLLVINSYLFEIGVSDFELLRPRFVLTGVLFFLVVALATVGAIFSIASLKRLFSSKVPRWERFLHLGLSVAGISIPLLVLRTLFSQNAEATLKFYLWSIGLGVLSLYTVLGLKTTVDWLDAHITPVAMPARREKKFVNVSLDERRIIKWLPVFFVALLGLFIGFKCVNEFTNVVLSYVPEQLGGVQPREVQFVIVAEVAEGIEHTGLPFDENGDDEVVTDRLRLLFEGSDSYVVQPRHPPYHENKDVFTISKDKVIAVYLERDLG